MLERDGDRKKWKDIVRQAKTHSGLQCQWKKKKNIYILTIICVLDSIVPINYTTTQWDGLCKKNYVLSLAVHNTTLVTVQVCS
jgi:hypothetical protein